MNQLAFRVVRDVWIAEIRISAEFEDKLRHKHGLSGWEVREACVPDAYTDAAWHQHPRHGLRLIVRGMTQAGSQLLVILAPMNLGEGIWRLRTAWRET